MRVSRSLTIKQMALVSSVALVIVCIFTVIQLFHFVQQRKDDYGQQMQSIAQSVRLPLADAMLNMDVAKAQQILDGLRASGILARADIVLPHHEVQVLRGHFPAARPVPRWAGRLFHLPLQLSTPLYGVDRGRATPDHPLGYLILQVDSFRLYRFILTTFATMVSTYLLLALILTVAVSWCMNRLLVHPLRALARELRSMPLEAPHYHQLPLPPHHSDDELGLLVRTYNRNQQALEKTRQTMSQLSTRYPQTNLPGQALFVSLLEQQCQAEREGQCVMMVSIPTLQEAMGVLDGGQRDMLLMTLVERLHEGTSPASLLAQASQDGFLILARDAARPSDAMQQAQRLMSLLTQPVTLDNLALRPTAAIGIAMRRPSLETSEAECELSPTERLLTQARSALNMALTDGKNRVLFFEPQLAERVKARLTQENEILNALRQGDFELYLQPQIDLRSQRLAGAEALIRWHRQDGGCSEPSQFIPLAEEQGGIVALGEWVLKEAVRILVDWQRRGLTIPLSLNVSALQLVDARFGQRLETLLQQHAISAQRLHLEITETAYISDIRRAADTLDRLRNQGVRVALDDFGMGYAGLNYLRHLPVDILKIDKSFIDQIPLDGALVRIVGSIAEVLSLDVVAEGVETQGQCDWLLANGIHYAQGYFFSPALSQRDFLAKYPVAAAAAPSV
ncbi:biofilm formation regulator HmsP [Edwardsiella piscicida]|nr:biofilm formation regulator HmsP [Edwardsiella piscicida]ARD18432.1 biofilm formation regulator HmsP [Edwardsiella piscicida]MDM3866090.1 biofilm formation regulator HmsP [Edwardsiella piscicida]QHR95562.1 biofilm formation regulator HmsP [Edwardsiella piscicida]UJT82396.1 biofilm formation regulator HmsP [Edwardsiella piscicida]UJT85665.1 biofilm formation regulator HmsP [Edwardsiella piscicida]